MARPDERVRALVREGKLPASEGERLLSALDAAPRPSALRLLFDPFDRIGGGVAVACGLVVAVLAVLATRLGVRFDGLLDLHSGKPPISERVALVEQLSTWLLSAFVFWIYGYAMTRRTRFIDILGMTTLSRAPLVLAAFVLGLVSPYLPDHAPGATLTITPLLGLVLVLVLVGVAWHVTLLFQGFKNATGLAGVRLVAGFGAMTVLSEIASKVAIASLSR